MTRLADDRPLRVLMVGPTPPPFGGVTVLFDSLFAGLSARRDVDATVVSTGGVRGRGVAGISAVAALASEIRRAARDTDVVTLHAATSGLHVTGTIAAWAARSAGRPLIVRKFGGTDFMTYGPARRGLILRALRRSALYLAETHELVEIGRGLGLRVEWFPNSRRMPPLPEGSSTPRACTRFVYLGQIHSGKGIRELIAAGEQLAGDAVVDVYGTLDFDITEHQFAGLSRVRYKGAVRPEDVHELLLRYDALVLPSYHEGEGYPGVVLEAYAAGLPVVSTRWRAIPELVSDDVTGVLVTPGDTAHLRSAMTSLATDAALCERLRTGVRDRRREYSDEVWHERFVALCRAVAGAPDGGADGV
jgi:glycosyltransferase involved in cell wall biosynthesis